MTIKVIDEASTFARVFQALSLFLVNGEEVGGVLLPNLAAHEVGDEKPTQVIHRVSPTFRNSELGRQFESRGDPGSRHPFSKRRLSLLNQGIHGYQRVCSGVDGVNTGVQVPDLLSVSLDDRDSVKVKNSLLFGDRDLEFTVTKPDLCYGDFRTLRHLIGRSSEVVGLLERVAQLEVASLW
ncbi:hypothetical protein Acr_23g0011370 [Actinidia rufa]|uniref:Uncharacterized protein n=1 Tax=Actinidia rufa TaxID=165716 RepID=A0A7J0GPN4_9ERIC|nr:hypothetical protein Acr_23g0011370 [Actinidia rufa]